MLHDLSHNQPQGSGADAAATDEQLPARRRSRRIQTFGTRKVLATVPFGPRVVAESLIPPSAGRGGICSECLYPVFASLGFSVASLRWGPCSC